MKSTALEKIVLQEMHLILLRAADMAVRWWREKKPQSWSIRKHLEAPTINCVGEREKQLARAAAGWYAVQRRIDTTEEGTT